MSRGWRPEASAILVPLRGTDPTLLPPYSTVSPPLPRLAGLIASSTAGLPASHRCSDNWNSPSVGGSYPLGALTVFYDTFVTPGVGSTSVPLAIELVGLVSKSISTLQ